MYEEIKNLEESLRESLNVDIAEVVKKVIIESTFDVAIPF